MANFVLDVFGVKGKKIAVLTISEEGGWDIVGGGFNHGGSWEWVHGDDTGYFIWLKDTKKDVDFGHLSGDWEKLPNPNGHPNKPWFSHKGVNSGILTIILHEPSLEGKWKLR